VAIYSKERDINVRGIKKHKGVMKRVVECLEGKNRLGAKKESA